MRASHGRVTVDRMADLAAQCALAADLYKRAGLFRLPTVFSKLTVTAATVDAVAAAARSVSFVYDFPTPQVLRPGTYCPTGAWLSDDRVRMLTGVAAWGSRNSFGAYGLVPTVGAALVNVFTKPFALVVGGPEPATERDRVVYAAADVVRQSKDSSLDALTWLLLWQWAVGGPNGNASVRARVMAMKAIQAVLRRGALLPGQIRAADSLAAVLQGLVNARAPNVSAAERDWFLSEAAATVGAVASARIALEVAAGGGGYVPPVPPPSAPAAGWVVPTAVAAGAVVVLGGLFVVLRRATAM